MTDIPIELKTFSKMSGRKISCKITTNTKTYYDDSLIKFDFDDIVHPDWFTIGTACSNEFTFTVRDSVEHPVHTEVHPFLSFNGGADWYPLGTFYMARRYFRGKYATFVCYDKMYDLDVDFTHEYPALTYTSAAETLGFVCGEAGLEFDGTCLDYYMYAPKKPVTLRQLIGYIAALNCACAKIDRYGKLVFKKYSGMPTEQLSDANCFSITRNITRAGISGLRANTGTEVLRYGEYTGASMIDIYNPFMRQELVNTLGKQLDKLYFYGAEIEMQGMPFMETGELVMLNENGVLTPISISEIKYHYDGALTAKLFSKNKSDADTVVHKQEFEDALAAIWDYLLGS